MFKQELSSKVDLAVIKPVNEPTNWVNRIVLNETVNQRGEITLIKYFSHRHKLHRPETGKNILSSVILNWQP